MNYVEKNNQILKEWFSVFQAIGLTGDSFAEDGIMFRGEFYKSNSQYWFRHESGEENTLWANAPLRILYLTKDQPSAYCGTWDVREECCHEPNSSIEDYILRHEFFYRNIVYSLYGYYCSIQGKKPLFEDVSSPSLEPEVLRVSDEYPFARINCKKIVGNGNCPQDKLEEALKKDEEFLKRQIMCLDADLIICCGNQNGKNAILEMLNRIGYNFQHTDKDSYDVYYDEKKQVVAIDSYHLSYSYGRYKYVDHYKDLVLTWQAFLEKHPGFLPRR